MTLVTVIGHDQIRLLDPSFRDEPTYGPPQIIGAPVVQAPTTLTPDVEAKLAALKAKMAPAGKRHVQAGLKSRAYDDKKEEEARVKKQRTQGEPSGSGSGV